MSAEVWALVGVVVGSVLGGGAQIVAGALTDRRAHGRWLREQRVAAYQTVLLLADSNLRGLREAERKGDTGTIPHDWDGGVSEALTAVQLFGSKRVAGHVKGLRDVLGRFSGTMPGVEDVKAELVALANARDELLFAVRADLGVK